MRLAILISSIAFLTSVDAQFPICHGSGNTWPDKTYWTVVKACENFSSKDFNDGQERAQRFNIDDGTCNNFVISHVGPKGKIGKISKRQCLKYMRSLFIACDDGGKDGDIGRHSWFFQ